MIFYQIQLYSIPKIKFSLHVTLDKYENHFSGKADHLEFTLIEKGDVTVSYKDRTDVIKEGSFFPIVSDMVCHCYKDGKQMHNTVGVRADYSLKKFDSSQMSASDFAQIKEKAKENGVLFVPYQYQADSYSYDFINNAIKNISRNHRTKNAGDELLCLSKWFEIGAFLTKLTLNALAVEFSDLSPMAYRYAEEIKEYIGEHLTEPIFISDIAEHLRISENYIHKIFKSATGMTVISYINTQKVHMALLYMVKNNTSAQKAAESVGISDGLYFCRLVKKYYGLSVTEYKKQKE